VNPAVLSADFRGLFPDGVAAAELRLPGDPSMLLPAEAACLGQAVKKRVQEFAAGRLCARRALAEFGIEGFALRVQSDRQALWPAAMVGSITHTDGLCAAVVAGRDSFLGVGVDSEVAGDVKPELWEMICTPREIAWLGSLPGAEQARAATLIFSAKEAFYKCQYPASVEFLDFHDVLIEANQWGAPLAEFTVRSTRPLAIAQFTTFPVTGRFRVHEKYVSAGIALPACGDRAGTAAAGQ